MFFPRLMFISICELFIDYPLYNEPITEEAMGGDKYTWHHGDNNEWEVVTNLYKIFD
jgi:hypothetical protein